MPERRVVTFRPGKKMKELVSTEPDEHETASSESRPRDAAAAATAGTRPKAHAVHPLVLIGGAANAR